MEPSKNFEFMPQSYEFFDDPKERKELFRYSKAIAEYLRTEEIPNLIIVDRSSRPLYVGVREYLRSKYPDETMPNMYFVNPKGFKSKEDLSYQEIMDFISECMYKGDTIDSPDQVKNSASIMDEFSNTYTELMKDKKKPVLVFDTCIHSGDSLEPIQGILGKLGFSDVRIGAVNPPEYGSKVQTDYYITRRRPEKGCYPFDRDKIIEKTFSHVYSKKTEDRRKIDRSVRLRKEISQIIKENLK